MGKGAVNWGIGKSEGRLSWGAKRNEHPFPRIWFCYWSVNREMVVLPLWMAFPWDGSVA